jgi:sugar transferase (PEP-CTERM/EpsH1 system associated)
MRINVFRAAASLARAAAPCYPPRTERNMRILFLAHRIPFPPHKGDKVRAFNELKILARRHEVHLIALSEDPADLDPPGELRSLCAAVHVARRTALASKIRGGRSLALGKSYSEGAFDSPEVRRTVALWGRRAEFDAVFAFSSSMAPHALAARARRRVLDLVDVDSEKFAAYAESARGNFLRHALYRLESRRLRALERRSLEAFDACLVVTEEEARLAARLFPGERSVHAVENGVDLDYFRPEGALAEGAGIVFTGAMDYPPNVDAVLWFAREVLPAVRERVPAATLTIVGREPAAAVRALASPEVRVSGTVPDVRPYFAAARVAVAPLRIARGIQNKVLEAMASGVPVVASPAAKSGIDARPGEHLLVADGARDFAAAVVRLLTDTEAARRIRIAARARVEQRYSWERNLLPMLDVVEGRPLPEAAAAAAAKEGSVS